MAEEKKPTLAEEAGLPESWHEVDSEPINPSQQGAPSTPNGRANYYDGSISPVMQHDFTFSQTKYGTPAIPVLPLMPVSPAGVPTTNSTIQSITKVINNATTTTVVNTGTGNMNFRGQWSSSATYAVDDVVLDNISAYIAIISNTNSEPESGSPNWSLLGKNLNFRGEWTASTTPATIGYVQSTVASGGTSSQSTVFSSNNAAGNTLIAFVDASHNFVSGSPDPSYTFTVTDTQGNVYTKIQQLDASNNANRWSNTAVYIAANAKAGANTVTVVVNTGSPFPPDALALTIAEYTGNPVVSPLTYSSGAAQNSSVSIMSTKVVTGQPNQIVVLLSGTTVNSGSETPPAGFNTRQAQYYDKIIASVSSVVYSLTYSGGGAASGGIIHGLALTNTASSGVGAYFPFDTVIYQGSTYVCIKTPTGGELPTNATFWYLLSQGTGGVNSLGGNYNIAAGDNGQLIINTTSSSYTATLLSPPPYLGWWAAFENTSTGTLTISPNGLTLDGSSSSLTLSQNQGVLIFTDGTNYFTERGFGTITSLPNIFNVNVSTGAATLANEAANTVFAGPTSGGAAAPTFRSLVLADLPTGISAAFGRKVVSTTSYTPIMSDVGKALDVQTSSATTITLSTGPAFVQTAQNSASTSLTVAVPYSSNNTAGNLLVAAVHIFNNGGGPGTVTVADSQGQTWTLAPGSYQHANAYDYFFYFPNCAAGANTVTVTCTTNAGSNFPSARILEYSNAATSSLIDVQTHATGSGTVYNSGNITTTNAPDILVGLKASETTNTTTTFDAGWTARSAGVEAGVADQITTTTGVFAFSGTQAPTDGWGAYVVAFKGLTGVPFSGFIQNNGTAVVTVMATSGLINGSSSVQLFPGQGLTIATDGTNYTVVWSDPRVIAEVNLTAQSAAITTTTLYAVPTAGADQYRLSWNAKVTTAATGAATSTLGALTIVYTDPDSTVQTITCAAQSNAGAIETTDTGNSTTTVLLGLPVLLNCKSSTNITYAFAYASNAANTMQYNVHIELELM